MADRRTEKQQAAVDADASARRKWYANWGGGAPRKPYTPKQRADLRELERAKRVLVDSVPDANNYAEAIAKLAYEPQYAEGWRDKSSAKHPRRAKVANPPTLTHGRDTGREVEPVKLPARPPKELSDILLPAYGRCPGFTRTCSEMRWDPALGHVPRGFRGGVGQTKDIGLVLVLAEPGDPYEPVGGSRRDYLSRVYVASNRDLQRNDRFAPNVRLIMSMAWPGSSIGEQLERTWITESVLCSARIESGSVSRSVERECATRYLVPQLDLLPNARVVALGSKARDRLSHLGWRLVAASEAAQQPPRAGDRWFVAAPHPSHRGAKQQAMDAWRLAVVGLEPLPISRN